MNDKENFFGSEPDLDIKLPKDDRIEEQMNFGKSSDIVHVTISRAVKDSIKAFAFSDFSRELGGVLIGSYEKEGERYHVRVTAEIKARYTQATKAKIKFTHETWEDIDKIKEEYYPKEKIVGWYHTHPGFGIFLSGYDLFIQKNFFHLPFQVAYVVDPVKKMDRFFGNVEGKIVELQYSVHESNSSAKPKMIIRGSKKSKNPLKAIISKIFAVVFIMFLIVLIEFF